MAHGRLAERTQQRAEALLVRAGALGEELAEAAEPAAVARVWLGRTDTVIATSAEVNAVLQRIGQAAEAVAVQQRALGVAPPGHTG